MALQLQLTIVPPKPPAKNALGFEDDEIRELGDKIASLSPEKARELNEYLKAKGAR